MTFGDVIKAAKEIFDKNKNCSALWAMVISEFRQRFNRVPGVGWEKKEIPPEIADEVVCAFFADLKETLQLIGMTLGSG